MDVLPAAVGRVRFDALGKTLDDGNSLFRSLCTLSHLVQQNQLKLLDPAAVAYNRGAHKVAGNGGGEAEIDIVEWESRGEDDPLAAWNGRRIAIKLHRSLVGSGGKFRPQRLLRWHDLFLEQQHSIASNRKEVNYLAVLRAAGWADRLPQVLGILKHPGSLETGDQPMYGYVMPAYTHGSLFSLLHKTQTPSSVFATFFPQRHLAGEFSELLSMLQDIHQGAPKEAPGGERAALMLQARPPKADISSNNILVDDLPNGGCRLLFSDPSQTEPIACLQDGQALAFIRALCVAMLHRHCCGTEEFRARIDRDAVLSWIMLWILMLGSDDLATCQQLEAGKHCRRPSEANMTDLASRLARITAAAQALGGGLTREALVTPAGQALVDDCMQLHSRLVALSQAHIPAEDFISSAPYLQWLTEHFMEYQGHPLVDAMRQKAGVVGGRKLEAPSDMSFMGAVARAQSVAGWVGNPREVQKQVQGKQSELDAAKAELDFVRRQLQAKQAQLADTQGLLQRVSQAYVDFGVPHRLPIQAINQALPAELQLQLSRPLTADTQAAAVVAESRGNPASLPAASGNSSGSMLLEPAPIGSPNGISAQSAPALRGTALDLQDGEAVGGWEERVKQPLIAAMKSELPLGGVPEGTQSIFAPCKDRAAVIKVLQYWKKATCTVPGMADCVDGLAMSGRAKGEWTNAVVAAAGLTAALYPTGHRGRQKLGYMLREEVIPAVLREYQAEA
ncbi:hypothetical protein ABPG75_007382 [Micractinium tetrahymenae]